MGQVPIIQRFGVEDAPFEIIPFTIRVDSSYLYIVPEGGLVRGGLEKNIDKYVALYAFELYGTQEAISINEYFYMHVSGVMELAVDGGTITSHSDQYGGFMCATAYKRAVDAYPGRWGGGLQVFPKKVNDVPVEITIASGPFGTSIPRYFKPEMLKYGQLRFYPLGVPKNV